VSSGNYWIIRAERAMPDELNWTAAMLLKWVLTRDRTVVLAMVDTYGGLWIFEDGTEARSVPEDVDAVARAYCVDETLESREEKVRTVVLRGQRVIAATAEIYRALRRGDLNARARRNGTGDIATINSNQWLSLRLKSWMGHDLAAPVNIEQEFLPLPHAIEKYLTGEVSADVLPAVWPDPLFIADQVLQLWQPDVEPSAPASPPTGAAQDKKNLPSIPGVASVPDIKRAIKEAARRIEVERLSLSEERLWRKVKAALSGKRVPRSRFREARDEALGPRTKGRPKKSPD
jgi:hypothetical protein